MIKMIEIERAKKNIYGSMDMKEYYSYRMKAIKLYYNEYKYGPVDPRPYMRPTDSEVIMEVYNKLIREYLREKELFDKDPAEFRRIKIEEIKSKLGMENKACA